MINNKNKKSIIIKRVLNNIFLSELLITVKR